MPGKLPIDRVREAQDAPKIYDEHRERFSQRQAELRDADDRVAGARPDATPPETPGTSETPEGNDA
ncbi:MAG: hypothetical protein WEG56_05105 [Chloroflexota bacterium]